MTVELQTPSEIVEDLFSDCSQTTIIAMTHGRKGYCHSSQPVLRDLSIVLARDTECNPTVWKVWQLDRTDPAALAHRCRYTFTETQEGWCPPLAWIQFSRLSKEIV